jgi:hypothetical protein
VTYIFVTRLHTMEQRKTRRDEETVLVMVTTREEVGKVEREGENVSVMVKNKERLAENLLNGWYRGEERLFLTRRDGPDTPFKLCC